MRLRDSISAWISTTLLKFSDNDSLVAAIDALLHSNRVRDALRGMYCFFNLNLVL